MALNTVLSDNTKSNGTYIDLHNLVPNVFRNQVGHDMGHCTHLVLTMSNGTCHALSYTQHDSHACRQLVPTPPVLLNLRNCRSPPGAIAFCKMLPHAYMPQTNQRFGSFELCKADMLAAQIKLYGSWNTVYMAASRGTDLNQRNGHTCVSKWSTQNKSSSCWLVKSQPDQRARPSSHPRPTISVLVLIGPMPMWQGPFA